MEKTISEYDSIIKKCEDIFAKKMKCFSIFLENDILNKKKNKRKTESYN